MPLRPANVRPPPDHIAGIADGHHPRRHRHGPGFFEHRIDGTGFAGDQHRDLVQGLVDLRLKLRRLRGGRLELGAQAFNVERRGGPAGQALLAEADRLALECCRLLGQCKAFLGAAQGHVGLRHFGRDLHLRVGHGRFCCLALGGGLLDGALLAAEDIDLPGGVETGVVEVDVQ